MATFRFAWVVAASGAIVMALEILSARILSPTFGSSVYVWGSVISVFLAALSLGYLAGGRLADRAPRLSTLGRLLLIATLFEMALLLGGLRATEALGNIFGTSRFGALAATAILFGPITTLLATVSPFAVRLAASEVSTLGNVSGRLYALSTAGSLAGTLGCTFLLIPFFEVEHALVFLIGLTVITTIAAMTGEGRKGMLTCTAAVTVLASSFMLGAMDQTPEGVTSRRMTPYQTLDIVTVGSNRSLRSDGLVHSTVDMDTGESTVPYIRHAVVPLVLKPDLERVAVLGLGSGSFGHYLRKYAPDVIVDDIEIDPAVAEVATEYFDYHSDERSRLIIEDGRRFLEAGQGAPDAQYDLIFSDTYVGLSIPFHLTTREFVELAKRRLKPDGILMVNVAANLEHPFSEALYSTVGSVFRHIYVFYTLPGQNHLIVATNTNSPRLSQEELLTRAQELQTRFPYSDPSLVEIIRRLNKVDMTIDGDRVLRDSYAPVDHLINLGETMAQPLER